jgi:glycerol-3-phosphate acyltransferase PlsY
MGAYAGLAPLPFLAAVVIFVILTALTRYVSLASVVICGLFPFMILIAKGPIELVYGSTIIALLIIFRHRANLVRLIKGTERKLGEKTQ